MKSLISTWPRRLAVTLVAVLLVTGAALIRAHYYGKKHETTGRITVARRHCHAGVHDSMVGIDRAGSGGQWDDIRSCPRICKTVSGAGRGSRMDESVAAAGLSN